MFPQSVCETVQAHAIDNLGMSELLSDPKVLDALERNKDLLKSLIAFKGSADPTMREKIREVTRQVVEDIVRKVRPRVRSSASVACQVLLVNSARLFAF